VGGAGTSVVGAGDAIGAVDGVGCSAGGDVVTGDGAAGAECGTGVSSLEVGLACASASVNEGKSDEAKAEDEAGVAKEDETCWTGAGAEVFGSCETADVVITTADDVLVALT
jgi:hypothetical protein